MLRVLKIVREFVQICERVLLEHLGLVSDIRVGVPFEPEDFAGLHPLFYVEDLEIKDKGSFDEIKYGRGV